MTLRAGGAIREFETSSTPASDDGRFAAWINLAGRQRMLSQRIGLFLLLAADEGDDKVQRREVLRTAVTEFADAHATLVDGAPERGLPSLDTPRVVAEWASGTPTARRRCEDFLRDIRQFVEDLDQGRPLAPSVRNGFVAEACSDVLAIMNRITRAVEADFNEATATRRSRRRDSTDRVVTAARAIASAARYARQVSFNAKISAVRAGPYGREFSALTEELKEIADQIGASSQSIIDHIDAGT